MPDTTPPFPLTVTPPPGSSGAGIGTNFRVQFSEPVQFGTGTVLLKNAAGTVLESFDVATSARVKISDATFTLFPSATLAPASTYTLEFPAGTLLDLAGNSWAGLTSSFTTNDRGHGAAASTPLTGSTTGVVEPNGETDWYSVALAAGQTYTFRLAPGAGSTLDPVLALYDIGGERIAQDDNSGGGLAAAIAFTPAVSGTYFLETDSGGSKTSGAYQLSFAGPDSVPPRIVRSDPNPNATTASRVAGVSVDFSEPIQRGAGTIVLRTAAGAVLETFDATSTRVTVSGSHLSVAPSANLAAGTGYRLDIGSDAVRDLVNNVFPGTSIPFATDDRDHYQEGATAIALGTPGTGTLDSPFDVDMFSVVLDAGRSYELRVDPASGSTVDPFLIFRTAGGGFSGANNDGGGNHSALLTPFISTTGTYYLEVHGTSPSNTGNYTVSAAAAPIRLTSTASRGVAPEADLAFTFNQPIARGTGNIVLKDAAGAVVETFAAATSTRLSISGSVLTVNPTADLVRTASYTLTFDAGSVTDPGGVSTFAGTSNYPVTVDDYAAAAAGSGSLVPAGTASGTLENGSDRDWFAISLGAQPYTFTVDSTTGSKLHVALRDGTGASIGSSYSANSRTGSLVVTPSAAGTYYLEVAAQDSYSVGPYTVTAADTRPPVVTSFAPLSGAAGVPVTSNIVITFSEPVQRGTGSIVLKTSAGTVIETFDAATSNRLAISGTTLTVDPTADLAYGSGYRLEFAAGTISDAAGNGYLGTSAYNFTTGFVSTGQLATALGSTAPLQTTNAIAGFLSGAGATQAMLTSTSGSSIVTATGNDGRKLLAVVPPTSASTTDVVDGSLVLHTELPAGQGLLVSGRDASSPALASAFLQSVVSSLYPRPAAGSTDAAMSNTLSSAIAFQQSALQDGGVTQTTVRYIDSVSGATGTGSVVLDTSAAARNELLMVNLEHLAASGGSVTLRGVENAVLTSAGTVRLDGSAPTRVTNDAAAQTIIGGSGNDTIISCGGNDTFTGGAGNDTYAVAGIGHYTITDFNLQGDRVAFNFGGINRIADLAPFLTAVEQTDAGVTFRFGPSASITLVGVQASQITGDHVAFHV